MNPPVGSPGPRDAALWLFADQLGAHHHDSEDNRHREVVLIESEHAVRGRRYHRQKLHIVLSGMRHLAAELGERATYLRAPTYRQGLAMLGRPVVVAEPTSHRASAFVERLHAEGLIAQIAPTTSFALPRAEFSEWAGRRRTFRLEEFYRSQRRRFEVLMDGDEPAGGRWNLDVDNRKPPPRAATLGAPDPWWPTEDDIDGRVRADLDALGLDTVGRDGPRRFAVTTTEAHHALAHFVTHRLPRFGPYEDAMLTGDWAMAHSLLSVPLNLAVLHPLEAVHAAEDAYRAGEVPLASAEGFIRQVLGWREYMWQLYWHFGPEYLGHNALGARVPLPKWWTELDPEAVTARCLASALAGVRDRGWTHHIQRLMVLGNHALQRGYDPRALSDWFRETYVDGFAWVMPPNVIGMSQHADGGRLATKPYASGGAYINRMSDHCRHCAFDPTVRVGDNACPYTAGYWAWVHRHEGRLTANRRTTRAAAAMRRLRDLDELLAQEHARDSY